MSYVLCTSFAYKPKYGLDEIFLVNSVGMRVPSNKHLFLKTTTYMVAIETNTLFASDIIRENALGGFKKKMEMTAGCVDLCGA